MFFFAPMAVNLLGFKINSVDNSSVINAGPIQYIDQFVSYKRNQGFGEQNGDLSPLNNLAPAVVDTDAIDSASVKNSAI